jgi:hypothetical protein
MIWVQDAERSGQSLSSVLAFTCRDWTTWETLHVCTKQKRYKSEQCWQRLPFVDVGVSLRYQMTVRSLQVESHAPRIVSFITTIYETAVQAELAGILMCSLVPLAHRLIAPLDAISAGQWDSFHHGLHCIVTCC